MVAELRAGHLVGLALLDVGDGDEIGAGRGALRRVVVDVRPPLRAPLAPAQRSIARGADVALAGRPPLGLVGREQARPAPALQGAGELPAEVDGVADAGVHAEPAGRDHQMHGVAGEQHAAFGEAVGDQQVLPPLADIEHLVLHRHGDGLLEHRRHVLVFLHHRMQREVPGRVLHDELRRLVVGDVVVAALADRRCARTARRSGTAPGGAAGCCLRRRAGCRAACGRCWCRRRSRPCIAR